MNKLEKWGAKKIEQIAKIAVANSVGKSMYAYGYEKKIPEYVKKWVKESK